MNQKLLCLVAIVICAGTLTIEHADAQVIGTRGIAFTCYTLTLLQCKDAQHGRAGPLTDRG